MNLGKQIKYYRDRDQLSQEQLAEKIYVSRQSISNWENEKSYPDIHNLLMLSVLFNISLDELVKGDVQMMENKLKTSSFLKRSYWMLGLMIAVPISVGPALYLFGNYGYIIPGALFIMGLMVSFKVEEIKRKNNLKTYRQILDFMEGKPVKKIKPKLRDHLFTASLTIASAAISFIVVYLGMSLFNI